MLTKDLPDNTQTTCVCCLKPIKGLEQFGEPSAPMCWECWTILFDNDENASDVEIEMTDMDGNYVGTFVRRNGVAHVE